MRYKYLTKAQEMGSELGPHFILLDYVLLKSHGS